MNSLSFMYPGNSLNDKSPYFLPSPLLLQPFFFFLLTVLLLKLCSPRTELDKSFACCFCRPFFSSITIAITVVDFLLWPSLCIVWLNSLGFFLSWRLFEFDCVFFLSHSGSINKVCWSGAGGSCKLLGYGWRNGGREVCKLQLQLSQRQHLKTAKWAWNMDG